MEPFVEAANVELGEARFRLSDHRHRNLFVSRFGHDLMMQNELVLVFENAHLEPQFLRNTGLAFADPFGVGFKDREYFFSVADHFTQNDAALDLVDLTQRVLHEAFNFELLRDIEHVGVSQLHNPGDGLAGAL